ncbi:ImmA/IrrE family metallo-endopeptidase [uncultured Ilyobacter sp.]|uniref:ImmA/IrrE family metallo-endopeptidase n=1 Tax=uncultured Ilyobacter sp. TaxID=544433 RepID=UPI0029BFBC2D|nr:ImmA/IrrE family metallo-endopeptidase [uncultured Ilyobacter sp.]
MIFIKKIEAIVRAEEERRNFGIGSSEPIDIFNLLKYKEKISVIKMIFSSDISGMILTKGNDKVIIINSEMSLGRQRFTAAHELYHLKYDKDFNKSDKFEDEADEFASHFLMPSPALREEIYKRIDGKGKLKIEDVMYLENYFGISHKAILKRLKVEKYINSKEYDSFANIRVKKIARDLGYNLSLYNPTLEKYEVYSNYAEIAKKKYEAGKMSLGKYENYLLEGGYENIVFGDDTQEDDACE